MKYSIKEITILQLIDWIKKIKLIFIHLIKEISFGRLKTRNY